MPKDHWLHLHLVKYDTRDKHKELQCFEDTTEAQRTENYWSEKATQNSCKRYAKIPCEVEFSKWKYRNKLFWDTKLPTNQDVNC